MSPGSLPSSTTGRGGSVPDGDLQQIREMTDRLGILWIDDEVIAGAVYAEETSLLGSIGVISAGLRLLPADRSGSASSGGCTPPASAKSLLDPFLPEDPADVARLTALQQDIHAAFKDHVRRRRAGKIDAADETLFSGEVLTGRMALAARPDRRHRRSALGHARPLWRQGAAACRSPPNGGAAGSCRRFRPLRRRASPARRCRTAARLGARRGSVGHGLRPRELS